MAVDESLFGPIQRALETFAVFGADPEARKAAAFRLGNSTDAGAAAVMSRARAQAKNPEVRAALEEAVAKQRLASPDPTARVEAVRQLAGAGCRRRRAGGRPGRRTRPRILPGPP